MQIRRNVGQKLKKLREKSGYSREQVAEKLDLSISTIAMYELGERIPRDEIKVRIANLYGKSVEHIFFEEVLTKRE